MQQRLWAFLACAALALGGIALGAELQKESVQAPAPDVPLEFNVARGYIIFLTAAMVATFGTMAAWILLRPSDPRDTRSPFLGALAVWFGIYLLVFVVQSAFANYFVCNQDAPVVCRQAVLRIMLLVHNEPSAPSLLLAPWAAVLGGLLLASWGASAIAGTHRPRDSPGHAYATSVAAAAIAVPFLAVATAGCLRLLLAIPSGTEGATLHLVVMPLAALVCAGLAAIQVLKVLQTGRLAANPRMALAVDDAWTTLAKAETAGAWSLAGLVLAGAFLPPLELDLLTSPRTFQTNLAGHHGLMAALAVPLAPALAATRSTTRLLQGPVTAVAQPTQALATAAVMAAGAAAALAAGFLASPLAAWVVAFLACAAATWKASPKAGALPLLMAGLCAWAIGNAIFGHFTGVGDNLLAFEDSPGVLALWRLAGATIAGLGIARLLRAAAPATRRSSLLASVAAAGVGVAAFIELPLGVWTESSTLGTAIALGSQLAREELAVRATAHLAALGLVLVASRAVARLLRPEWFTRPGMPVPTPRAARAP